MRSHKSQLDEWEVYRDNVTLYYHDGWTQADIQKFLAEKYNFKITKKQLEYRLKRWGLRKYLTQRDYQFIHKLLATKSRDDKTSTHVYLNNFRIPWEKLRRGLQRYPQLPPYKLQWEHMGSLDSPPDGLSVLMPSGSLSSLIDFDWICEVDSNNSSLISSSEISNICWPFLPSVAQFLLTAVDNPSFIRARLKSALLFLEYISVALPVPRMCTYEEVKTTCADQGTIYETRNTSLFYAVSGAFASMNIGHYAYNIYRKFLDSFVAEEFIHTVFSVKGSRGTSTVVALQAVLEYQPTKSGLLLGTGTLLNSSVRPGTSTSGSGQSSTSEAMSKKRKRPRENPEESRNIRGRPDKMNRKEISGENFDRRLACPFAKGDPASYTACWRINRQNLSGIKEHLKRGHYSGTLPSGVRAMKSWAGIFDYIFPHWGNGPRPSPYVDIADVVERAHRPRAPTPSPTRPAIEGTFVEEMDFNILEDLGIPSSIPSRRASPTLAPITRDPIALTDYINHERVSPEAPTASIAHETPSTVKKYVLMVTRLPSIPGSKEKPGLKRFAFDTLREFGREFERWLKTQFTDPPFNWQRWELLNQFTNLRLGDTQAVMDDIDFSFVAQNSTRAALYLVAKDEL